MKNRSRTFGAAVALGVAFLLIYRVQAEIDKARGPQALDEGPIYIQDPDWLRRLSLGYESLLADVYWMRAVQYYGQKPKSPEKPSYELLYPMLNLATSLDPEMTTVYRFGAMFLSESPPVGPGEPGKAIQLLDKGIRNNPGVWRFYFDKGFVYLWHLKDYKAAGQAFLEGSRRQAAATMSSLSPRRRSSALCVRPSMNSSTSSERSGT